MNICRYFYTLRDLKSRQLYYQAWYRLRGKVRRLTGWKHPEYRAGGTGDITPATPFIPAPKSFHGGSTFSFLNVTGAFDGWNDMSRGRLWIYNLNYMDFLLQQDIDFGQGLNWIERFLADAPNNPCGYEPYPIALRGINWIKFILNHKDRIEKDALTRINDSLYSQYQVLARSVEYHLLGNHLLEDGFSLVLAGIYFSDKKLFGKGSRIVKSELKEQILEDGAHYELSPMYHRILLGRLLDCINIMQAYSGPLDRDKKLLTILRNRAALMLGWMNQTRFEDGTFPLLNDSAEGIAYTYGQLDEYAARLDIAAEKRPLKTCGYRKISSGHYECFIDIGHIGPSYIPGHAHADTFNFVLRIDGQDIISDTGISTYEKNDRRQYERSTAAHNTVVVAGMNSSDVWGGFRAGRKARVKVLNDSSAEITAEHDGYRHLGVIHRRQWRFHSTHIEITDRVFDKGKHEHVAILNLCPDFVLKGNVLQTDKIRISIERAENIEIIPERISRAYNDFSEIKKVKIHFADTLKIVTEIL